VGNLLEIPFGFQFEGGERPEAWGQAGEREAETETAGGRRL
jgi:hypothetical protein